ncbi:MAG: 2-oxoacid:acceptor oxidoreductase family protein [Desulfurococcaceae archaeon]
MKWEILIVGRGGQGVLLMGRVLGFAADIAGLHVVVTESYAAETRGGESQSNIIIATSRDEIDYVKAQRPDIAVFMYPFSLDKYKSTFKPSTIVIVDEEYVDPSHFKGYRVISARFSEIAEKVAGTRRVANIVILGRLIKELNAIRFEHVRASLAKLVPQSWLESNLRALEAGYNLE